MAFTAANVTYSVQQRGATNKGRIGVFKLTFGNGAITYTSAGVPLTKGKLGCPNSIRSLAVLEDLVTSGYRWDYDVSAGALKGFYGDNNAGADGGLIQIPDATAIAAQEVWVEAEGY